MQKGHRAPPWREERGQRLRASAKGLQIVDQQCGCSLGDLDETRPIHAGCAATALTLGDVQPVPAAGSCTAVKLLEDGARDASCPDWARLEGTTALELVVALGGRNGSAVFGGQPTEHYQGCGPGRHQAPLQLTREGPPRAGEMAGRSRHSAIPVLASPLSETHMGFDGFLGGTAVAAAAVLASLAPPVHRVRAVAS